MSRGNQHRYSHGSLHGTYLSSVSLLSLQGIPVCTALLLSNFSCLGQPYALLLVLSLLVNTSNCSLARSISSVLHPGLYSLYMLLFVCPPRQMCLILVHWVPSWDSGPASDCARSRVQAASLFAAWRLLHIFYAKFIISGWKNAMKTGN